MSAEPAPRRVVAGHQPNFFPWFGYFEKMLKADVFVFSDDVRYPSRNFVNRVAIPIGGGVHQWALPVRRGGDERIADKHYVKDEKTLTGVVRTARYNLGGLPHGGDIERFLDVFVEAYRKYETLADLNIATIDAISRALSINTPTVRGSELGLDRYRATDRLLKRLERLDADAYLSGQGAHDYTDVELFAASGRRLIWIDYVLGPDLLGNDLPYSVLVGIARHGLARLSDAVEAFRETRLRKAGMRE
ncbi:MAG: hypothetical protein EA385_14495 [Salinarimonadaceae bacterium]|nr:MAG: hypothetical protein EA385_14495 [Salinarimonadaceae bacterium]